MKEIKVSHPAKLCSLIKFDGKKYRPIFLRPWRFRYSTSVAKGDTFDPMTLMAGFCTIWCPFLWCNHLGFQYPTVCCPLLLSRLDFSMNLTQIVSSDSSWANNHSYVHFDKTKHFHTTVSLLHTDHVYPHQSAVLISIELPIFPLFISIVVPS